MLQAIEWLGEQGGASVPKERLFLEVYDKFEAWRNDRDLIQGDFNWLLLEKSLERLEEKGRLRVDEEAGQTMVHLVEQRLQEESAPAAPAPAEPAPAAAAPSGLVPAVQVSTPVQARREVPPDEQLQDAVAKAPKATPVSAVSVQPAASAEPASAEPVLFTSDKQQFRSYEQVDMKATRRYSTEDFIYEVLKAETPIHRDLVAKRLAAHKGHLKVNKHVKAETDKVLNRLPGRDQNYYFGAVFMQEEKFIYRIKGPARPKPRRGGDREFAWIAPEEIDAGVLKILKWLDDAGHTNIAKEQLLREVYAKFAVGGRAGSLQQGDANWLLLEESLDRLEEEGRLWVGNYSWGSVVYLLRGKG